MTQENNSKLDLAPIVLFVYNRPDHTKQTVEALQKNELANESELFIYSDAAKNENAIVKVNKIREYIKTINGFKKVTIIEREKNWGLDSSIIDGVTNIVNKYGKIIVLEDDLVTSPYFLKFINEALEFYKNEKKVWHISGWNYPINIDGLNDVFLWRLMNCWGWATWADRWKYYEKDIGKTVNKFTKKDINRFNLNYGGFWKQVVYNLNKKDNNWDIRWYSSIFKKNGLCVNPAKTFVVNIGLDGSGIHCGSTDIYTSQLTLCQKIKFETNIEENKIAVGRVKHFYKKNKKNIFIRAINKLRGLIK